MTEISGLSCKQDGPIPFSETCARPCSASGDPPPSRQSWESLFVFAGLGVMSSKKHEDIAQTRTNVTGSRDLTVTSKIILLAGSHFGLSDRFLLPETLGFLASDTMQIADSAASVFRASTAVFFSTDLLG